MPLLNPVCKISDQTVSENVANVLVQVLTVFLILDFRRVLNVVNFL